MPQNQPNSDQPNTEAATEEAAAIYVRVSSTGQLGRDGDEDGYSIPAQVKACEREAANRGATVAKVYIERAETAKSDDRPVLQQMLRELPTLGVKYLIVHKVDRLARNRLDDATLYQRSSVWASNSYQRLRTSTTPRRASLCTGCSPPSPSTTRIISPRRS